MFNQKSKSLVLGKRGLFSLKVSDKERGHLHIIGGSGIGKTCEIYNLVLQDIEAKRGVKMINVHGDLEKSLERVIYYFPLKQKFLLYNLT